MIDCDRARSSFLSLILVVASSSPITAAQITVPRLHGVHAEMAPLSPWPPSHSSAVIARHADLCNSFTCCPPLFPRAPILQSLWTPAPSCPHPLDPSTLVPPSSRHCGPRHPRPPPSLDPGTLVPPVPPPSNPHGFHNVRHHPWA